MFGLQARMFTILDCRLISDVLTYQKYIKYLYSCFHSVSLLSLFADLNDFRSRLGHFGGSGSLVKSVKRSVYGIISIEKFRHSSAAWTIFQPPTETPMRKHPVYSIACWQRVVHAMRSTGIVLCRRFVVQGASGEF